MTKKKLPRAATWYELEKGVFKFKKRFCPKCGSVMAFHKEPVARWHCGKCGFTQFQR
ncbi:MAG: 30S ribosomal protein S27ae [Pyrobaculum sp.]